MASADPSESKNAVTTATTVKNEIKKETIYPAYARALAGAGAGACSAFLLHPFDTISTQLQSSKIYDTFMNNRQVPNNPKTHRLLSAPRLFLTTLSRSGLPGLYCGVLPAAIGSVASWSCYFHICERLNNFISPVFAKYISKSEELGKRDFDVAPHFISNTIAGVITAVATNPIWVLKVRLQLECLKRSSTPPNTTAAETATSTATGKHSKAYSGLISGFKSIIREEGARGLFTGLRPSIWLVANGSIQYTLYELIKFHMLARRSKSSSGRSDITSSNGLFHCVEEPTISVAETLTAAMLSKTLATVTTYPLEVARTRMQEKKLGVKRNWSVPASVLSIYKTEGVAGLYRGLGANIVRVSLSAAVVFVSYEELLKMLAKPEDEDAKHTALCTNG